MSVGEIYARVHSAVRQRREIVDLRAGITPQPPQPVKLISLFTAPETTKDATTETIADSIAETWSTCFNRQPDEIEALQNGRLNFFGCEYDVGAAPAWHRDPDLGVTAPLTYGKTIQYRDETCVGNIKTLWELGRHQHLIRLAADYAVHGTPQSLQVVKTQIESWIASNPYGYGIHWASSLEVALRGIAWTFIHGLISIRHPQGGLLDICVERHAVEVSIYQHCHFIRNHISTHSSANNHLMGEVVGLWCMSSIFSFGEESDVWRDFAQAQIEAEAVNQVHADGVLKEQAVHYQLEVMEYLLVAALFSKRTDRQLNPSVTGAISNMAKFIDALSLEGGHLPQIGDSDEGTVTRFKAGALERPELELLDCIRAVTNAAHRPAYEKSFWYAAIANAIEIQESTEQTSTNTSQIFPDGGYAVLTANRTKLVFDAGPLGYPSIAAHGHADALAFCLGIRDLWWIVDPGTYAYHGDQTFRNYFKGTTAHNTLCVNDTDQSESGGPFMWVKHAQSTLIPNPDPQSISIGGTHTGYEKFGVTHGRSITLSDDGNRIEVADNFGGIGFRDSRRVKNHIHFAPQLRLELSGNECLASLPGTTLQLRLSLDPAFEWRLFKASEDPILGWYSPGLGRKEPAWTLQGAGEFDQPGHSIMQISLEED
ncbi:MAG: alginate lyase family protein [Pseudomonadota bacterium]